MKKILFCNVPMSLNAQKCIYTSDDFSVPVSSTAVMFPVNAFLEKTLKPEDEIKAILLVKKDQNGQYKAHVSACIEELMTAAEKSGAIVQYKIIDTEFSEKQSTHDNLLMDIVNELEENVHITADITYGPKDLPIVLFTALNFAEKYFNCQIDNIVYGQAHFVDGKPTQTCICDMVPLYYLNSVANSIQCDSPEKAKEALSTLLSI